MTSVIIPMCQPRKTTDRSDKEGSKDITYTYSNKIKGGTREGGMVRKGKGRERERKRKREGEREREREGNKC